MPSPTSTSPKSPNFSRRTPSHHASISSISSKISAGSRHSSHHSNHHHNHQPSPTTPTNPETTTKPNTSSPGNSLATHLNNSSHRSLSMPNEMPDIQTSTTSNNQRSTPVSQFKYNPNNSAPTQKQKPAQDSLKTTTSNNSLFSPTYLDDTPSLSKVYKSTSNSASNTSLNMPKSGPSGPSSKPSNKPSPMITSTSSRSISQYIHNNSPPPISPNTCNPPSAFLNIRDIEDVSPLSSFSGPSQEDLTTSSGSSNFKPHSESISSTNTVVPTTSFRANSSAAILESSRFSNEQSLSGTESSPVPTKTPSISSSNNSRRPSYASQSSIPRKFEEELNLYSDSASSHSNLMRHASNEWDPVSTDKGFNKPPPMIFPDPVCF